MACRPSASEEGGREIRTDRGPELMDQMSDAAVGIAVFVSDVSLREPIDEDGSQRLVLTMVGRGIGIPEELATAVEVHGCTLE
jgi:hypothetical protein